MIKLIRITVIGIVILALFVGAGYWIVLNLAGDDEDKISKIAEELEQQATTEVGAKKLEDDETNVKKQPGIGMTEEQLQIYMHQMTHQKVTADKKRGAVEMSQSNITNLKKIVQVNYDAYEHSDFYEKTLIAWENGDFSNAVSVHNTIWKWHNGNVGRATGLMTPEQEAEYVEKNFK